MLQAHEGVSRGRPGPVDGPDGVIIDNRTGLPDSQVREAIMASWVENAAFQFGSPTSFQMYAANNGSILNRAPFQTPGNVIEEIKLARMVVETDDDCAAIVGSAIATAFGQGMENLHEDEKTVGFFNKMCREANMDLAWKELYREYLIAGGVHSVTMFARQRLGFTPDNTETELTEQLAVFRTGTLPAENVRILSTDLFGDGDLGYDVPEGPLRNWLLELFSDRTSEAMKAKMRRENPVAAALFTEKFVGAWDDADPLLRGQTLFKLHPRMVHRTTMAKGASPYPRPPLTANFALLEAKRLLNVMDYSLLQGGTNYIVVAKIGSDQKPGMQPEVDNLEQQVRMAARTGVLVGDHRVSIDIITPDLTELLNPAKRKLLGRKLTMALLRIPEQVVEKPNNSDAELKFIENTITSDRQDLKRHVERYAYEEAATRNRRVFKQGAPKVWFPKIVLSGVKDFFDQVVKARDRGDIPRKWAVEALGFDYEAGVAQREREINAGHDEILVPGNVPFDANPGSGQLPNGDQGGGGRPPGTGPNNGAPGARQGNTDPAQRQRQARPRLIPRRRGSEPTVAVWNDELESTVRVGELTQAVLEQFPDRTLGRVTDTERRAANGDDVVQEGSLIAVPVNTGQEWRELRAFRLDEGVALIVGQRQRDNAIMAAAITFRDSHFTEAEAVERAVRWGFWAGVRQEDPEEEIAQAPGTPLQQAIVAAIATLGPERAMEMAAQALGQALGGLMPDITIVLPEEGEKVIRRDPETGAIIAVERKPPEVRQ